MNTVKAVIVVAALAVICVAPARGQGFLNLNFESAQNLPGNPGNGVLLAVTNALPDWTAYDGSVALSSIYYVSNYAGSVSSSVELEGGSIALDGDFSVGLFGGISSISQTGQVPANAESLDFEASFGSPNLQVTLGEKMLSYVVLSQGPGYSVYGVNIPAAMDGQMETLTFGIEGLSESVLDNIQFSTMSVPEPAEWAIIGVGAILVGVWRRCRRAQPIYSATDFHR